MKMVMLEGIADKMIEEDKAECESSLATSRSPEKFCKCYRNFMKTQFQALFLLKSKLLMILFVNALFSQKFLPHV